MLIGELARQAGLTPATIRFYERSRLLEASRPARRDNNYKEYGPEALERLRFIARAKSAGFTLREIARLLSEWDTLAPPERRQVVSDKIGQVEGRIAEMERMKGYLTAKLASLP